MPVRWSSISLAAWVVGAAVFGGWAVAEEAGGLSAERYADRQSAMLRRWAEDDREWPDAESSRLETAARTAWVRRRHRLAIGPETPPAVVAILEGSLGGGGKAVALLRIGQFTIARRYLQTLPQSPDVLRRNDPRRPRGRQAGRRAGRRAGRPSRRGDRRTETIQVAQEIMERFALYYVAADRNGQLDDLLDLIDTVASEPALSLCRLELMRHLDRPITASNLLPSGASVLIVEERSRLAESLAAVVRDRWQPEFRWDPREDSAGDGLLSSDNDDLDGFDGFDGFDRFPGLHWADGNAAAVIRRAVQTAGRPDAGEAIDALPQGLIMATLMTAEPAALGDSIIDSLGESSWSMEGLRIVLRDRLIQRIDREIRDHLGELAEGPDGMNESQFEAARRIAADCLALAIAGEIDVAIESLSRISPMSAAAAALDSGRYRLAAECLRKSETLPGKNSNSVGGVSLPVVNDALAYRRYIDAAIGSFDWPNDPLDSESDLDVDLQRLLLHMSWLWSTGQTDHATTVATALWDLVNRLDAGPAGGGLPAGGAAGEINAGVLVDALTEQLSGSEHESLIYHLLEQSSGDIGSGRGGSSPSGSSDRNAELIEVLVQSLPEVDIETFRVVTRSLRGPMPEASLADRVAVAMNWLRGRNDPRCDVNVVLPELARRWIVAKERLNLMMRQPFRGPSGSGRSRQATGGGDGILEVVRGGNWMTLEDLVRRHGMSALGDQMVQVRTRANAKSWIQYAFGDSILRVAKRWMDRGQNHRAEAIYERLIDHQFRATDAVDSAASTAWSPTDSSGWLPVGDADLLVDALIGLSQCRVHHGPGDPAARLLRELLIHPRASVRCRIAEAVGATQPLTTDRLRSAMIATAAYRDTNDLYSLSLAYAKLMAGQKPSDVASTPKDHSIDVPVPIRRRPGYWYAWATSDFGSYPPWWTHIAHRTASYQLRTAIDASDRESAAAAIDRLLAIAPVDITLTESTLPQLRQLGWNDLADRTIDRVMAAGREVMRRYPVDAGTANNLAWVAAVDGVHLPEALRWARAAVDANPDSVIYRDTLAEVLFAMGRTEQAEQIERACLIDDDEDWHVHQQVERFAVGD